MVRSYDELNRLEQVGLTKILQDDDWTYCELIDTSKTTTIGKTIKSMCKRIDGKEVSVNLKDFHVDED